MNLNPFITMKPVSYLLLFLTGLVLLTLLVGGCGIPPHIRSLDDILEQAGRDNGTHYGFRCTAGAHRGASVTHKENTRVALMAADDDKRYAFIEFDVQYTSDSRMVVFHDKRMLRLFGSLRSIEHTPFADLTEITNGEIAAYDEVMPLLKKKLNIEIKSQGDPEQDQRLADEIVTDIRARKRTKDVLISSISRDVILYINEHYPDIATGQVFWLTSSTYLPFDGLTENLYEEITATQADFLMLHVANLRNIDDLLKLKPRGKTVVFWDFDDTMYVVHKDLSDRLWGTSRIRTFFQWVRYKLLFPFLHSHHRD